MDELQDLLAQLVGKLSDEDMNDPEVQVLMEQLQMILHPMPEKLSQEMIEELSKIPDKKQRFKQAAMDLGISDPEQLKELADAMKISGLLGGEQ